MRSGINFEDRNRIREMADAGLTAQDISMRLVVELSVIEAAMPDAVEAKAAEAPQTDPTTDDTVVGVSTDEELPAPTPKPKRVSRVLQ